MARNVTQKLLEAHLTAGSPEPGTEIGLSIDQTLMQDATGTLVMLELEAMGLDRARTELSAQYVDHNLLQEDYRNPDDHLFLQSAAERFGLWFSGPGNGVSHPVHMQYFGKPGRTLLGSDSHTCAAGGLGMLAIGAGGLDVAMAIAGHPLFIPMPEIWGVELTGTLPDWVSAKDVILEMLRRHGVSGGLGRIIEYHGPGLEGLSVWDRHVIANMGAELGATTTVFPADEQARRFLRSQGREEDWSEWVADEGATYDVEDAIDMSALEPLIAKPQSPGNVVPVRSVEGEPIYQSYIGSSANPGYRDFAVAARIVEGKRIAPGVSLDINPASRQILIRLMEDKHLGSLLRAGARLHQAGCNGCIGMGQAPAMGRNSLRTVPRNFPGRSGTREDSVWLCSPETAAASALTGKITDPRRTEGAPPVLDPLAAGDGGRGLVRAPLPPEEARRVKLVKGPNIMSLPVLEPLPDRLEVPVLLTVGDDLSTDSILPAGSRVLPYRSNIEKISTFAFEMEDPTYHDRALEVREAGGHAVVAGKNYGQGSSREHAALAPRWLGLRVVLAASFARIHWQNLVNFGVLPLVFTDDSAGTRIRRGDTLVLEGLHDAVERGETVGVRVVEQELEIETRLSLSKRQREVLREGGLMNWARHRTAPPGPR